MSLNYTPRLEVYRLKKITRRTRDYVIFYGGQPFNEFIYDKSRREYCGLTPYNWVIAVAFHLCLILGLCIFYIIVEIIWNLIMISSEIPYEVRGQPTLAFQPVNSQTEHAALFKDHFNGGSEELLVAMDRMTSKYGNPGDRFGPCNANEDYGYIHRSPCILLKINRVIGWQAETYDSPDELPSAAPAELKEHMKNLTEKDRVGRVWFTCESKSKNLMKMVYYPSTRSVPKDLLHVDSGPINSKFYTTKDYERMIAVQFEGLPRGHTLKVKCFIWGKNINIDESVLRLNGCAKFRIAIADKYLFLSTNSSDLTPHNKFRRRMKCP